MKIDQPGFICVRPGHEPARHELADDGKILFCSRCYVDLPVLLADLATVSPVVDLDSFIPGELAGLPDGAAAAYVRGFITDQQAQALMRDQRPRMFAVRLQRYVAAAAEQFIADGELPPLRGRRR